MHALGKVDGHLGVDQAPVLPPSSPFFCDIHHDQIQHFQETVIGREHGISLGDLAQLAVEALNGVGGVDRPAHLLWVLEIGAQVGPVGPPELGDFRGFLSQRSPRTSRASRAACSSTVA